MGGIPELLLPEDTVLPGEVAALASKIPEVVTHPKRMAQMSAGNWQKAKDYKEEILHQILHKFFDQMQEQTKK